MNDASPTPKRKEKKKPEPAAPTTVEARTTINLPGLPAGNTATVHPDDPYIAGLLRRGYLTVDG